MRPRYVLHPGWIYSITDGQRHWIGVGQLAELYRVRPSDRIAVVGDERSLGFRDEPGDVHCYPRARHTDYPICQPLEDLDAAFQRLVDEFDASGTLRWERS